MKRITWGKSNGQYWNLKFDMTIGQLSEDAASGFRWEFKKVQDQEEEVENHQLIHAIEDLGIDRFI